MTETDTTSERPTAEDRRSPQRVLWIVVAVLVSLALLTVLAKGAANLVAGEPWDVEPGVPVEVSIAPGTPASGIYDALHEAGVARRSALRDAARAAGVEDSLQAGTYALTTDMAPDAVIRALASGTSMAASGSFTVVEGWSLDRILDELGSQTSFTRSSFEQALVGGSVTSPLLPEAIAGVAQLALWEGLLYPATYPITPETTPASLLQHMADEMTRRFESMDWTDAADTGLSRYELLIVASLIEREAGIDADRPLISSVIANRLDRGMRLQIDATVVYAVGGVDGVVTADDLETESPYNTYMVDGLPPTPIGTVTEASLAAAIRPADTDYLFYVLASPDGSHAFATTYEEHQANVAKAKADGVLP